MEIDQIFVGIHVRCARLVSSLVPRPVRSALQAASLLLSLFLLASLIWLHHQHIHPQGTHYSLALAHLNSSSAPAASPPSSASSPSLGSGGFPSLVEWMRDSDVLRVRIEPPSSDYDLWRARGWASWWADRDRIDVRKQTHGEAHEEREIAQTTEEAEDGGTAADGALIAAEVSPHPSQQQHCSTFTLRHVNRPPNYSSSPALSSPHTHSDERVTATSVPTSTSSASPASSPSPRHVYEYAHHKGYFLLPASLYARHRVVTTTVTLSAAHRAFGPFPLSFFTYHLYGYDSIVLNHLIRQMRSGFMRNAHTSDIYTISSQSQQHAHSSQYQYQYQYQSHSQEHESTGAGAVPTAASLSTLHRLSHLLYLLFFKSELLVTTLFLFFATTTLVSSTLVQTQLRMLHFTEQLRQHVRLHLPIVGLVLEHTMQSLSFVPVVVGILFFLFEFFNDHVLAFLLLVLVWLCESYTVLFTRTATAMLYFPKLFALYFLMFAVYFFSFPYGFHYIAMGLTASQLYTCILYYWFDYEIPAVEAGDISIHRPRMLVLRRADGGDREREEAHSSHVRSEQGDRLRGPVEQGRGSHDVTESRDTVALSSPAVRSERSASVDDSSDVHEFEFSRRSLPRISTSSTLAPARSAVSLAPALASAASYPTSLLPVPTALSASSSAPGSQVVPRRASGASHATLLSELATLPPSGLSPAPTSASLSSVSAPAAQPASSHDAEAEAALQRLHSLPPLLHTLLRNTQRLKAQYAPPASPSPRHSHGHFSPPSHRARAASAHSVSPTLSSSPSIASGQSSKDELRLLSDARQALSLTLPPMSLSSEDCDEQKELPRAATSPRAVTVGLVYEAAALHKVLLDQLSNVLQVALYALTTLVQQPPPPASALSFHLPPTASLAAGELGSGGVGSGSGSGAVFGLAAHSLPVPTSPVCRSPRSPQPSATPPPPPRSSPPSAHRTAAAHCPSPAQSGQQPHTPSAAAAPVRRLVFSQPSTSCDEPSTAEREAEIGSTSAASASHAAAGGSVRGRGPASEPASPDSDSDAPMM